MELSVITEFHNKVLKSQISAETKTALLSKTTIDDARNYIVSGLENEYEEDLDTAYSYLPQ